MSASVATQFTNPPVSRSAISNTELELTYNIGNAPIREYPYPHIYVPDVFPKDFYAAMQRNLPDSDAMIPIEKARPVKGYKERFVLSLGQDHLDTLPEGKKEFWQDVAGWLLAGRLMDTLLTKFQPYIERRFQNTAGMEFRNESLLVQDVTKYALGPHTDASHKVITLLFYLPKDLSQSHLGTSIYLPKERTFTCPGGPHYGFEDFRRVATMPFQPNSLFGFVKTNNSFHGVEPVLDADTRRWLLLYDIYTRKAQPQKATSLAAGSFAEAAGAAPAAGKVGRNEVCPCGSGKKYKHCHGKYA
jgi:hypothetical protein